MNPRSLVTLPMHARFGLMSVGRVLIVGGFSVLIVDGFYFYHYLDSAELYDPVGSTCW